MSDSTDTTDTSEIADIGEHLEQAVAKVKDLAEVHLPAIAAFLQRLRVNPLVTAFSSVVPGEVGADAQAVLNGLLPILGALGARGLAQPPALPAGGAGDGDTPTTKDPWS